MTIAAQSVTWLGIEAGSWPAWASAAVTSVAVAFAAITYRQNSRDRRSAQARKVYAKESTGGSAARRTYEPGDVVPDLSDGAVAAWHQRGAIDVGAMLSQETWIAAARTVRIVVELHNDSDEPILRWFPRLYDYGLRTEYDVPEQPMGLVDPHSVTRIVLLAINPHPNPGEPGFLVNVTFEDSAGRLWRRAHGKPIEELSGKDPSRKSFPR